MVPFALKLFFGLYPESCRFLIYWALSLLLTPPHAADGLTAVALAPRRATPATLTGVSGRPIRAWALSIDSEMPPCSDQPKDNNAAHVKAVAARAVFRACFMGFLRCAKNTSMLDPDQGSDFLAEMLITFMLLRCSA